MGDSYSQIHIQLIFTVQNRDCIIRKTWEEDLYKYLTGVIQNHNHKVLAINGMPDHVHILIGMRPTQSLSELMKNIKGSSSLWINKNKLVKGKFSWQEGYGAFSYSRSQVNRVIDYIKNQKEHHKKKSFIDEYREFLEEFVIDFNEQYLFHKVEYDKED